MSKNDITGDNIKSRPNSDKFNENFDKIFGGKVKASSTYGDVKNRCTCLGCSGHCSSPGACERCCGRACSGDI